MYRSFAEIITDGHIFYDYDEPGKAVAHIPSGFRSNHASTLIELQNGDLLCPWFAGLSEGSPDIKIVFSRLKKGSDSWSKPEVLSEDYTRSEQNPVFFQEPGGRLYIIHTAQESRGKMTSEEWREKVRRGEASGEFTLQETSEIRCRYSDDNGYTWSTTTTMFSKPGAFCRHSIVILSDGSWVLPMWYSVGGSSVGKQYGGDYSVVQRSEDCGKTWTEYRVPESERRVHMGIIELEAGHCVAFFRSRSADWIYRSESHDYGRTWTAPTATILPNNNASIQAVKLQSGRVAIIFNNYQASVNADDTVWPKRRYPVDVALSEDAGLTFPYRRTVEFGKGFTGELNEKYNCACEYPCIMQSKDGRIHMAYSYQNRAFIKYLNVTEDYFLGFPTDNRGA